MPELETAMLSLTTRTTASAAPEGTRCQQGLPDYELGGFHTCSNTALWIIRVETVHGQPTPQQALLKGQPGWGQQTQRRYATKSAYCAQCIPKRHRSRGLKLGQRNRA